MIEQICKLETKINKFIDKKEYNYYALAPSQFGLRNPEDTPFSSMTKAIIIAKAKGSSPYRNTAETNRGTGYAEQFNQLYGERYDPYNELSGKYIYLIGCTDYSRTGNLDEAILKQAKKVTNFKIN